jgi:hypothetical protein
MDYVSELVRDMKKRPRRSLLTNYCIVTQEGVKTSILYLFGILPIFKSITVQERP